MNTTCSGCRVDEAQKITPWGSMTELTNVILVPRGFMSGGGADGSDALKREKHLPREPQSEGQK